VHDSTHDDASSVEDLPPFSPLRHDEFTKSLRTVSTFDGKLQAAAEALRVSTSHGVLPTQTTDFSRKLRRNKFGKRGKSRSSSSSSSSSSPLRGPKSESFKASKSSDSNKAAESEFSKLDKNKCAQLQEELEVCQAELGEQQVIAPIGEQPRNLFV
jgi:hypothetical protein